jgi:DNA-binding response OmpR family regulator
MAAADVIVAGPAGGPAKVARIALERAGVTVQVTEDLSGLLALLDGSPGTRVVIVDAALDGLRAVDLSQRLQRHESAPELLYIALGTGTSPAVDPDHVLPRTFSPRALQERVRAAIKSRDKQGPTPPPASPALP